MRQLSTSQKLMKAASFKRKGEIAKAIKIYNLILQEYPGNSKARSALKAIKRTQTKGKSAERDPSQEHFSRLESMHKKGGGNNLKKYARTLLQDHPNSYLLWNIFGIAAAECGETREAIRAFRYAINLNPKHPDSHNNLGNMFKEAGRYREALELYDNAISIYPQHVEAINNKSIVLKRQGNFSHAIQNLKNVLSHDPNNADALNTLSNVFLTLGRTKEAMRASNKAIEINPNFPEAYVNLAGALSNSKQIPKAIEAYKRALALRPGDTSSEAVMLHLKRKICDWSEQDYLNDRLPSLGISTKSIPPFAALSLEDHPARQLKRSRNMVLESYKQDAQALAPAIYKKSRRLRVGYFSSDFHDHATMYLMSGVFREHNTKQFEIFCYSYGREKSGQHRKSLQNNVEHFFDIDKYSDIDILNFSRSHGIDIAIDLKGHTRDTRTGVFQFRLAPLQINFLGYPGSLGASFFDYIIADKEIIPLNNRGFYDEKVIFLPNCYQPNDISRKISERATVRNDFELTDESFVFCCFNNNYKITSEEFDIWARVLHKVPNSVLWLMKSNKWAEKNLRREASLRDVASSRLIFADHLEHATHLERIRHADLFLDTFNCNAHTTASDALWAGVPIVSKRGQQFAARVGASLLRSVGLSELVVDDNISYETLIYNLATNPEELRRVREKLAINRLTMPLFDTVRFTRNLENAFKTVFHHFLKGDPSTDVWIQDYQN